MAARASFHNTVGPLGLLRPGPVVEVEGLRVPLPRPADLIVEKLLTDRTGERGARDLLVVAGLLAATGATDLDEEEGYEPQPCGREVAPEKTMVVVDERRLSRIETRRPIPVGLGPDFLAARVVALVPFDETQPAAAR